MAMSKTLNAMSFRTALGVRNLLATTEKQVPRCFAALNASE